MNLPREILELLNDEESIKTLTSVSADGVPHSVVIGSTLSPQPDLICAAEIMMKTTSKNLQENPIAVVLVVKGMRSYQIITKVIGHQTEGVLFNKIKTEIEKKGLICRGVWMFDPIEIYEQSAGPNAGKKIA